MKNFTKPTFNMRFVSPSLVAVYLFTMIFTLNIAAIAQPAAPTLLQPANLFEAHPHTVNLVWQQVVDAVSYQVQVSDQSDFSTTFLDESLITDTTKFLTALDFSTTYYWRVHATNGVGTGVYSDTFSFVTWASVSTGPDLVDLGESERFAILAHTAITNVPASAIKGDIGLSPTAGTFIGITQEQITGSTFTVDALGPAGSIQSTAMLTTAKNNLTTAFNDAAGRSLSPIAISGNIGGQTLYPGLYKSTGTLEITAGDLTLDAGGNADAVWIFQVASSFNMTSSRQVFLINGANTANIFWQVGTMATFGTAAVMKGTVMAGTQLTFATGARLDGRALALTADVTLQQNVINRPISGASTSITGTEGWRILASPYSELRFYEFLEPLWTQGPLNSDDPITDVSNVFNYNEAAVGDQDSGFETVSDLNDMMVSGKGYAVFVYSDANGLSVEGNAGFPQTLQTIGSENASAFDFPVTFTDNASVAGDGWNLIGTPSTNDLNWATVSKTNMNVNAYLYNSTTSAWVFADGNGTGDVSDIITPYEGFFVKATAINPALSTVIVAKSSVSLQSEPKPIFRLSAEKSELAASFSVLFSSDALIGMDNYDAYALTSLGQKFINVVSPLNGVMLSRQAVPSNFEGTIELPLSINSTLVGDITMTPSFENIPSDWSMTLVNNSNEQRINLREVESFTHTAITAQKAVSQKDRLLNGSPIVQTASGEVSNYTLIIKRETTTSLESEILPKMFALEQNYPNPFNPSTTIHFDVASNSNITLQVVDITGRLVQTLVNEVKTPGSYTVSWNASNMASGMYLLRMQTNNGVLTQKMTLIK
jgi:hypothetical protein